MGLHAALTASLALLDNPNALDSLSHRVVWGQDGTRPIVVKETPRSLAMQAWYWLGLIETIEGLNDAAAAVAEWRAANTAASGSVALGVLADHLASLAPTVHERAQIVIDMSPTFRTAMRQVEARRKKMKTAEGGVA